ncbi:6280_t:CDS:1, partial [Racocetra fulgida]
MSFFVYLQNQAALYQALVQEFQTKLTRREIEYETNNFNLYSGNETKKKSKHIESWAKSPHKVTKMPYHETPRYQKSFKPPIEEEYLILTGLDEDSDKAK